jgi:hypothetical protein
LKELIAAHLHGDDKTEAEEMLRANHYSNAAGVIQLKVGNDLQKRLALLFKKNRCPEVEARYKLLDNLPFRARLGMSCHLARSARVRQVAGQAAAERILNGKRRRGARTGASILGAIALPYNLSVQ